MRRILLAAAVILALSVCTACKDKASCHTQAHGAGSTFTYCA